MSDLLSDAVFWISIVTLTIGLIKYNIKYMTRYCKISSVSCCWGCFSQQRDIKGEIEIEKARIDAHIEDDNSEDKMGSDSSNGFDLKSPPNQSRSPV